jgi:hypothetical protein
MRYLPQVWHLGCGDTAKPACKGRREVARQLSRVGVWKGFVFELGETRVFEVPLLLFERRHFYRSELS